MIKGDISRPSPEKAVEIEESPAGDETSQLILKAIRQFTRDRQSISADDNLELDLGLDSLSKIELVASLEKTFSIKLPENFLADIYTVGELTEKIKARKAGGFSAEAVERTSWKNILATEPEEKISFEESGALLVPVFLHTYVPEAHNANSSSGSRPGAVRTYLPAEITSSRQTIPVIWTALFCFCRCPSPISEIFIPWGCVISSPVRSRAGSQRSAMSSRLIQPLF